MLSAKHLTGLFLRLEGQALGTPTPWQQIGGPPCEHISALGQTKEGRGPLLGKMVNGREQDWGTHLGDIKRALLKVGCKGAPRGPHLPEHGLAHCGNPGQPSWPFSGVSSPRLWSLGHGHDLPLHFPLALSGPPTMPSSFYCLDRKGSYQVTSVTPALPLFTQFPLLSPETPFMHSCIHSFTKY